MFRLNKWLSFFLVTKIHQIYLKTTFILENKNVHSSVFGILKSNFSNISSLCHARLWGHKMKHYSRINILLTVNSGERIVTGCAGMRPQHTDVIMDAWPAAVHGGGKIYLKLWKYRNHHPSWVRSAAAAPKYCTKRIWKRRDRSRLWPRTMPVWFRTFFIWWTLAFYPNLGPSFLTPDTITLLGVLSMIVLFIRKVRLSKSDLWCDPQEMESLFFILSRF